MNSRATDVTELLLKWKGGNDHALEQLIPVVYQELRTLAQKYLRQEQADHTLQPTALVHEAYLRLMGQQMPAAFRSRFQFEHCHYTGAHIFGGKQR